MNHHCAGQCWETCQHPQKAPYVGNIVCDNTEQDLPYQRYSSLRSSHKGCSTLRIAKSRNDERVEVGNSSIGDGLSKNKYPGQVSAAIAVRAW